MFQKLAFGLLCLTTTLNASMLTWNALDTENFTIFYPPKYKQHAINVANELIQTRPIVTNLVGSTPEKFSVVIEESGLSIGGSANAIFNRIRLNAANPSSRSFTQTYSFTRLLTVHEAIHIAQLSSTSGLPKYPKKYLGNIFSPNIYTPRWLSEGIAVVGESSIQPYEGRGYSGKYQSLPKIQNATNTFLPLSLLDNDTASTYLEGEAKYLYGYGFMAYLEKTYSTASVASFFQENSHNIWAPIGTLLPKIGIDKAANKAFGKPFNQLYKDWQASLPTVNVKQQPLAKTNGQITRLSAAENKLWFVNKEKWHTNPQTIHRLYEINTYNPQTTSVNTVTALTTPIESNIIVTIDHLYYLKAVRQLGYQNLSQTYGKKTALVRFNRQTKTEDIIKVDYFRDITRHADGQLYAVSVSPIETMSKLWRLDKDTLQLLGDISLEVSEIQPYLDNFMIIAKSPKSTWSLYQLNLTTLKPELSLNSATAMTQLTIKAPYAYFTADTNSQSQTYQYHLQEKTLKKLQTSPYDTLSVPLNQTLYTVTLSPEGESLVSYPIIATQSVLEKPKEITGKTPTENMNFLSQLDTHRLSLKTFKKPKGLEGLILAAEDQIGLFSLAGGFTPNQGVFLSAGSKVLSPLTLNLSYSTVVDNIQVQTSYPLYDANIHHDIRVDGYFKSNFSDETDIGFFSTYRRYNSSIDALLEKELQDSGHFISVAYNHYTENQRFLASFQTSKQKNIVTYLPGYNGLYLKNVSGIKTRFEATQKLMTLNKGIWNPTLGIGSLFATAFYTHTSYLAQKYAYGLQLESELQTGISNLRVTPQVGYVFSKHERYPYIAFLAQIQY